MAEMTVLDVVNGISQAMANSHDGALDEDGEPLKIGLRREEEVSIYDTRVMDGFKVAMVGNQLTVKYHGEVTMDEAQDKGFDSEMGQRIEDIVSFLKKEFRKHTGSSLNLKKLGDHQSTVQSVGAHRSWVQTSCVYEIKNFGSDVEPALEGSDEDRLDKSIRKWLDQGRKGKAKNDKRPATKEDSK
jgi:hypothetical protein